MDDSVLEVLRIYHDRIEQERTGELLGDPAVDPRDRQLLAVGPDTGQFINILAKSLERPQILEIGTSYGYSGIWLAEAARASGGRLTSLELQDYKSRHAREMSERAGLADYVDFRVGDALELIDQLPFGIDFVLLDLWKSLYVPCLQAFCPKLRPGAIIVADNMISGGSDGIRQYAAAVRALPNMRSVLLPVGSGLEVSRFEP